MRSLIYGHDFAIMHVSMAIAFNPEGTAP